MGCSNGWTMQIASTFVPSTLYLWPTIPSPHAICCMVKAAIIPTSVYVSHMISCTSQLQIQSITWQFSQTKNKRNMHVNWHIHFILDCHLNFGFSHVLEKLIFWEFENIILICKNKTFQSSTSVLRSHMFLQMLKMVAQSIVSTSSPQTQTHIRASRVFKFNLLRKWLLIAFCLEKNPLSQIIILDGMSVIFCQSCKSLSQFMCHSKLLPHMRQASNIIMFSHSYRRGSLIPRVLPYTCHFLLRCIETSAISFQATIRYLWFDHYHCESSKFDCIEYWKVWETIIQSMNNSLHIRCTQ